MAGHGLAILRDADLVVPVPLHPHRRRTRGYNQAVDLAAHLPLPSLQALRRTRHTPTQTGLPAGQRHRNVRHAFAPARRTLTGSRATRVIGRVVVLVDDVATTGATLEACGRVLKEMGAREIRALTAARVVLARP
jgi:ComF family protein